MGPHEVRSPRCSFCDSSDMSQIMDFGEVALAGGFLKPAQFDDEKTYPLRLYFCGQCFAVQVVDKVSADVLLRIIFTSPHPLQLCGSIFCIMLRR